MKPRTLGWTVGGLLALAPTVLTAVPAMAKPPTSHSPTCHGQAAKCGGGGASTSDPCDTDGIEGATIADQLAERSGVPSQGIVHDPYGDFGPLSGPIYSGTRGTPAAAAGTEAACALNSVDSLPAVGYP